MAGALEGKVKVPGVGELPKGAVVLGLVGVGVAIYYYRSHNSSTAAATTTTATAGPYPPDGTTGNPSDLYSIDPATGQTYGNEQAGFTGSGGYAGAAGTTDSFPWDGTTGNSADPFSMDPSTGNTYGNEGSVGVGGGGGGGGGTSGPPFSTNAEWSQYVLSYFSTNSYSDIPARTSAIGSYIAGASVTATGQGYINDAIAIAGLPPVSGASGKPPAINVHGGTTGSTKAQNPVAGLKASAGYTGIDVSWSASKGATSYTVTCTGASNSPATVTAPATSVRMRNVGQKQATITVTANPAASGVKPATTTVKVK